MAELGPAPGYRVAGDRRPAGALVDLGALDRAHRPETLVCRPRSALTIGTVPVGPEGALVRCGLGARAARVISGEASAGGSLRALPYRRTRRPSNAALGTPMR